MAKRGRPPVLDDTKKQQILVILHLGCSRRIAAKYVGCSPSTIQNTARRDPEFAEQLGRVENQAEIGYLKRIKEAASDPKHWRAAAWVLERRNPEDFAPRRHNVMDIDDVIKLIEQLTAMIIEEVPVEEYRKPILKRTAQMMQLICPGHKKGSRKRESDE